MRKKFIFSQKKCPKNGIHFVYGCKKTGAPGRSCQCIYLFSGRLAAAMD